MKRKEFLKTFSRFSILAAAGGLVVLLNSKDKITLSGECSDGLNCGSCGKLNNCNLEEAANYKKNGKR